MVVSEISEKEFRNFRKNALLKLDKSSIGGIDSHVLGLCEVINSRLDMFTLSSCSGRVSVQRDNFDGKQEGIWVFVSHELVEVESVLEVFSEFSGEEELSFMQEAVILHVCVCSLDVAQRFMHLAKCCGFNQCGIISCAKKIVVEVVCDARMELPVFDSEVLVSEEFLERVVERANLNLEKSWECISKLEKGLKDF